MACNLHQDLQGLQCLVYLYQEIRVWGSQYALRTWMLDLHILRLYSLYIVYIRELLSHPSSCIPVTYQAYKIKTLRQILYSAQYCLSLFFMYLAEICHIECYSPCQHFWLNRDAFPCSFQHLLKITVLRIAETLSTQTKQKNKCSFKMLESVEMKNRTSCLS